MAGVGVDVVAAQPGLHQLVGRVAFPHRPLAGAEHADGFGTMGLECGLGLLGHDGKRLLPAYRLEFALLVVNAVPHAQQRLGQAVAAVHDLGQEVALDAVQAAVDLGFDVAVGGHHAAVLGRHHHAAAGAAEAAGRLVPVQRGLLGVGDQVARRAGDRQAGGGRRNGSGLGLGKFSAGQTHAVAPSGLRSS